jgi:hypothetical protein
MSITSASICAAAEQLQGLVGFHAKAGHYIVRFSEDAFGMDVPDDSIVPISEFVWSPLADGSMRLSRARLQLLLDLRLDERLHIDEALRVYMLRQDLPEITAQRSVRSA